VPIVQTSRLIPFSTIESSAGKRRALIVE